MKKYIHYKFIFNTTYILIFLGLSIAGCNHIKNQHKLIDNNYADKLLKNSKTLSNNDIEENYELEIKDINENNDSDTEISDNDISELDPLIKSYCVSWKKRAKIIKDKNVERYESRKYWHDEKAEWEKIELWKENQYIEAVDKNNEIIIYLNTGNSSKDSKNKNNLTDEGLTFNNLEHRIPFKANNKETNGQYKEEEKLILSKEKPLSLEKFNSLFLQLRIKNFDEYCSVIYHLTPYHISSDIKKEKEYINNIIARNYGNKKALCNNKLTYRTNKIVLYSLSLIGLCALEALYIKMFIWGINHNYGCEQNDCDNVKNCECNPKSTLMFVFGELLTLFNSAAIIGSSILMVHRLDPHFIYSKYKCKKLFNSSFRYENIQIKRPKKFDSSCRHETCKTICCKKPHSTLNRKYGIGTCCCSESIYYPDNINFKNIYQKLSNFFDSCFGKLYCKKNNSSQSIKLIINEISDTNEI